MSLARKEHSAALHNMEEHNNTCNFCVGPQRQENHFYFGKLPRRSAHQRRNSSDKNAFPPAQFVLQILHDVHHISARPGWDQDYQHISPISPIKGISSLKNCHIHVSMGTTMTNYLICPARYAIHTPVAAFWLPNVGEKKTISVLPGSVP
jgi:hypothetical protein